MSIASDDLETISEKMNQEKFDLASTVVKNWAVKNFVTDMEEEKVSEDLDELINSLSSI